MTVKSMATTAYNNKTNAQNQPINYRYFKNSKKSIDSNANSAAFMSPTGKNNRLKNPTSKFSITS